LSLGTDAVAIQRAIGRRKDADDLHRLGSLRRFDKLLGVAAPPGHLIIDENVRVAGEARPSGQAAQSPRWSRTLLMSRSPADLGLPAGSGRRRLSASMAVPKPHEHQTIWPDPGASGLAHYEVLAAPVLAAAPDQRLLSGSQLLPDDCAEEAVGNGGFHLAMQGVGNREGEDLAANLVTA
jgi:hypothetical protein